MSSETEKSPAAIVAAVTSDGKAPTHEEFAQSYMVLSRFITDRTVATTLTTILAGYISAVSFHERAGAAGAQLPTMTLAAAGMAFAAVTMVSVYLGALIRRSLTRGAEQPPAAPPSPSMAAATSSLMVLAYLVLLVAMLGHLGGFLSLTLLLVTLGAVGLDPPRLGFFHQFAFVIVFAYCLGRLVYPAMPHALGGGRPIPVRVVFSGSALARPEIQHLCREQTASSTLYQVYSDGDRFYFAIDDNRPFGSDAASVWIERTLDPPLLGLAQRALLLVAEGRCPHHPPRRPPARRRGRDADGLHPRLSLAGLRGVRDPPPGGRAGAAPAGGQVKRPPRADGG